MSSIGDIAESCIDALLQVAVHDDERTGWPAWRLGAPGEPPELVADDVGLYNGDAGIAWALAHIGAARDRADLVETALRACRRVAERRASVTGGGLLAGVAGLDLAAHAVDGATGVRNPDRAPPVPTPVGADLTDGAAGVLLAQVRTGARAADVNATVATLVKAARADRLGVTWPTAEGEPLCGLAHGNSGIALALAEAAAAVPDSPTPALECVGAALQWERAWYDQLHGWPDLRDERRTFPVMWCHGAAGIGAVRLRLLQLAARGLDLGVPLETVLGEAQAAVQICAQHLRDSLAGAGSLGAAAFPGGLTLCHGLGGALDVLALAHETWGVTEHLDLAREVVVRAADVMGDDPLGWPCGVPQTGSCGLFLGLAGVAMVTARLAYPDHAIASPSLLGSG